MADDKKNIPDAGKVNEPAKAENTEPKEGRTGCAGTAFPIQTGGTCGRGFAQSDNTTCGGKIPLKSPIQCKPQSLERMSRFENLSVNKQKYRRGKPLRHLVRVARVELTAS